MNYEDERIQYHLNAAEALLSRCRDGQPGVHGSYAPSACTVAQAATAHAILAQTMIAARTNWGRRRGGTRAAEVSHAA